MPRNQDLNLLPIFDALVQEEQLSRAATRLSMSQPAVSKALQRLRLSFHDELFVRTKRGLKPTPRALELHRALAPALSVIRKTFDATPFAPEDMERVFNVSMNSTVELLSIPAFIARFCALAPKARLRVHPEYLQSIPARLKDGRLDYAIDFVDLPEDEFDSTVLVQETLHAICAPGHPMAGRTLTPAECHDLRHVSVMPRNSHVDSHSNQMLTPLEHLLGQALPDRNVACHASGFIAVPDIVSQSHLVAIAPERLVASRLEAGTLSTLNLPIERPSLALKLYWHRSRINDPAHPWFMGLLKDVVKNI